jgi:hypothetical protein
MNRPLTLPSPPVGERVASRRVRGIREICFANRSNSPPQRLLNLLPNLLRSEWLVNPNAHAPSRLVAQS